MAHTLTLGRGLNEGGQLNETQWFSFCADVMEELKSHDSVTLHFYGSGIGTSDEWGWEDAYTYVFDIADWFTQQDLMDEIVRIRAKYGQEAVAYTVGKTHMV